MKKTSSKRLVKSFLWYNHHMKKETLKELGKYFLDISKILLALTLITPFMKQGDFSLIAVLITLVLFAVGVVLTNKGAKDE